MAFGLYMCQARKIWTSKKFGQINCWVIQLRNMFFSFWNLHDSTWLCGSLWIKIWMKIQVTKYVVSCCFHVFSWEFSSSRVGDTEFGWSKYQSSPSFRLPNRAAETQVGSSWHALQGGVAVLMHKSCCYDFSPPFRWSVTAKVVRISKNIMFMIYDIYDSYLIFSESPNCSLAVSPKTTRLGVLIDLPSPPLWLGHGSHGQMINKTNLCRLADSWSKIIWNLYPSIQPAQFYQFVSITFNDTIPVLMFLTCFNNL